MRFLLEQRSKYLTQLQLVTNDPNSCLTPSASDDSESSDEESESSKVNIKIEPTENNSSVKINMKSDDESVSERNVQHPVTINIKEEVIDERMDCEEKNDDDMEIDFSKPVENGEIDGKTAEKTVKDENGTEKTDEDENNKDEESELKPSIKLVKPLGKTKDEESCSSPKVTVRRRRKSKKDLSEDDQMPKIEARKSIKIKQEPDDFEHDADVEMIDGVGRELRPRKLNDPQIYFEPYSRSSSEDDSDFSDLLNSF